jgi:hypothetical protein
VNQGVGSEQDTVLNGQTTLCPPSFFLWSITKLPQSHRGTLNKLHKKRSSSGRLNSAFSGEEVECLDRFSDGTGAIDFAAAINSDLLEGAACSKTALARWSAFIALVVVILW